MDKVRNPLRRPSRRAIAAGVVGIFVVGLLSVTSIGAEPLAGTGTNVTWATGSEGTTTGTGEFECGTVVNLTMATGGGNSGLGFTQDWSTVSATDEVFAGGITPDGAIAVWSDKSNPVAITFSYELTNPIVLVNYIDTGASMDFGAYPITLIDSYSLSDVPSVVGNTITLGGTGTAAEGWAVQVSGTFGPTSGPLTFAFSTIGPGTSGVSVAVPSGTACEPTPTTSTTLEPEPTPAVFTG